METKELNLAEVFEPIVLLVCKLKRADSRKISLEFGYVRKAIIYAQEQVDRRMRETADPEFGQKMRSLTEHFLDSTLTSFNWAHGARWQAEKVQILSNLPSEFAVALTLKGLQSDPAFGQSEREFLGLLHSLGWLKGEIAAGLLAESSGVSASPPASTLCLQAYQFTDRRDFTVPVAGKIGRWILLAVLAAGALFVVNYLVFWFVAEDLAGVVDAVKGRGGFR